MSGRTIAVGDIHGCLAAFDALLAVVKPTADDTLIPLGDFIDRGPDSAGVLARLLQLQKTCRLAPILGNHEEMLLLAGRGGRSETAFWLQCGGDATVASYGGGLDDMPFDHIGFLSKCLPYYETATHIFLHANYDPDLPLAAQSEQDLRWLSLAHRVPGPHRTGKIAVVGHTSQRSGEVLDLGHLVCIDTYCHGGQWLTALDVDSGRIWQADRFGSLRADE